MVGAVKRRRRSSRLWKSGKVAGGYRVCGKVVGSCIGGREKG